MRMIVWSRGQALAVLSMILGLTMGVTALLLWSPGGKPPEEEAVAAFAAGSLFTMDETPEATGEVVEIPVYYDENTQAVEETSQIKDDNSYTVEETPSPTENRELRVEIIRATPVPPVEKSILIYHTHTWEAFAQVEEAPYEETEKWRTKDNNANVVAVGEALTAALQAMGYTVVHDTTAFEPPNLSDAYTRSLAMLEERINRGESYDLYIDLHRDAYVEGSGIAQTVNIGGEEVARLMMLIGKGTGDSFTVKPDWEANYALAERITEALNDINEDFCRRISVKTGRFNQHVASNCVLIECGNNMNTLEEVLCSVPYLAQAIQQALEET